MKYRKASEVLPDELIKEIQKYTSGEELYIPVKEERKEWGASSGAKSFYTERNDEIKTLYSLGNSMEELSKKYALSIETIRKIIYSK